MGKVKTCSRYIQKIRKKREFREANSWKYADILRGGVSMYVCMACGYVYDPEKGDPDSGIAPGTAFEDIPDTWVCPVCGVGKDMFQKQD